MEIIDSDVPGHKHPWLQRLGLEDTPPRPDSWVPVARAFKIDDVEKSTSSDASRLSAALDGAGVESQQHPYEVEGPRSGIYGLPAGMVERVAVLVRHRDLARAIELAREVEHELGQEPRQSLSLAVPEDELERQALQAGPAPEE